MDAHVYDDVAQTHLFCALGRPYPHPPTTNEVATRLGRYAGLAEGVGLDTEGWDLLDAHICPNGDRRLGHYIYRRDDRIVSLIVAPRRHGSLPPVEASRETSSTSLHLATREGLRLTGLETPGHVAFVVSDFRAPDHEALSIRIAATVAAFLRAQEGPLDRP